MSQTPETDSASADVRNAFAYLAGLIRERNVDADGAQDHVPATVAIAARAVPHSDWAGLTVRRGSGEIETIAATHEVCGLLDTLQYEVGEGPCVDAITEHDIVGSEDFATEPRWPRWIDLARDRTPVRSMIAMRLYLTGSDRAALSFYARSPGAFDDVDRGVAAMFSSYLSQALAREAAERKVANLEQALGTSRQIGAAMGILMARELMTFEQAFDKLRSASQRLHRKLRDVAAEVVDTGELPG